MRSRGFSLLEMVMVIALTALIVLCAMPAFAAYRRRASMISQATELRSIFRSVRARAIARNRAAGVKFMLAGSQWTYALYEDGDGDGIRSDDIRSGVDRRYSGPSILMPQFAIATIALLPTAIRDPDGEVLSPTQPAVQFGTAGICSFGPTGNGTPGSVYITDRAGTLQVVRVSGATGRVRTLRYNAALRRWDR
jgi:prepilin-type N-terminal cleavage/methylation domain-containing protein